MRISKKRVSVLALTLRDLIKASGMSQGEWAEVLGVPESTISRWVNDVALPRPEHIKSILSFVRRQVGSKEAIDGFYKMAKRPAGQVTPLHRYVDKNIGYHLAKHSSRDFYKKLLLTMSTKTLRENERYLEELEIVLTNSQSKE